MLGKICFLPDHVEINWRLKDNVFTGGKGEMQTIDIPYNEIEHAELVKDIPGVTLGKMSLEIDSRSREEAKKLNRLIDFKRSVFPLDEHEQRLAAIGDE